MRAAKQVIRLTYFPIRRLGVSGLCGCAAHVTFQDRLVGPIPVLQEWNVVCAHPFGGSHLVGGDWYEVQGGAHQVQSGGACRWSVTRIGV